MSKLTDPGGSLSFTRESEPPILFLTQNRVCLRYMRRFFSTCLLVIVGICFAGGAYLLLTATAPIVAPVVTLRQPMQPPAAAAAAMLYIPKINVEIPFARGDASTLETGAWWRQPASGNPADGGNFVLAAHRFQMGWTPARTARQSPLYHIDKLAVGDDIIVDYEHTRYAYQITKIYRVPPTAGEIEAATEDTRLTLYSCTLGGASDGREVIIARKK